MTVAGLVSTAANLLWTPNENALIVRGRGEHGDRSSLGLLFLHGSGGAAMTYTILDSLFTPSQQWAGLIRKGMVLLASDAGGPTTWGSDAAMAAIDAEYAYLTGTLARPGKIIVWGYSMGGCNAINWTYRNPDKVAAMILTAPASDLDYFEANATFTAAVRANYGGTHATYLVQSVGHNPLLLAPDITVPARIVSAVDDPTVPNGQPNALYAALGSADKQILNPATGGHTAMWQWHEAHGDQGIDSLGLWALAAAA